MKNLIDGIEFLGLPTTMAIVVVGVFFILQIIGELLEFKGKAVPEFIKIRKYFKRKKQERETMHELPKLLAEIKKSHEDMMVHYNADNIKMRDEWIKGVNLKLTQNEDWMQEFAKKLDKNNQDTLAIRIDNIRNAIINFASIVIDEKNPVTREQFNRIFKQHEEYEDIIKANGIKNGEVDIAYRIISESYETHMRNHSFIEDIRGYH
jgi:predicted phage tail protein